MATGAEDRAYWVSMARRVATPVLTALAARQLRATMPVEAQPGAENDRARVTHLEALGRTLCGLAPWLAGSGGDATETSARATLLALAQQSIDAATDPASPDFMNFSQHGQPLVDAAFLAHAILRAPQSLFFDLPASTRKNVLTALESTRVIRPAFNNWLLFAAMVEAALCKCGASWDVMRVDYAIRQHLQWYKGDGVYGDGPDFHWDYYNSFVIQPMLLDVLETMNAIRADWKDYVEPVRRRAVRFAEVQERLIAPDGTFPPIGRSLAYRCGAFQHLAQMALRQQLPEGVVPAQVRGALTAVIRKTLGAPGTFDERGWLTIGFCGHQLAIGEFYISTGSLYLCTAAFLPLGLPPDFSFWHAPAAPWTSQRLFSGDNLPCDHALH